MNLCSRAVSSWRRKVAVCYLRDVCHPSLVTEVLRRLGTIDIDGVVDSGYLEQYIEDHNISPFPQIQNTERPDKSVANLLEGRVVILVDGSPFALIAPAVFSQFYQSVDDYSERFVLSSFVRLSRLVALLFSGQSPVGLQPRHSGLRRSLCAHRDRQHRHLWRRGDEAAPLAYPGTGPDDIVAGLCIGEAGHPLPRRMGDRRIHYPVFQLLFHAALTSLWKSAITITQFVCCCYRGSS